jgi:hypothetical protein
MIYLSFAAPVAHYPEFDRVHKKDYSITSDLLPPPLEVYKIPPNKLTTQMPLFILSLVVG